MLRHAQPQSLQTGGDCHASITLFVQSDGANTFIHRKNFFNIVKKQAKIVKKLTNNEHFRENNFILKMNETAKLFDKELTIYLKTLD